MPPGWSGPRSRFVIPGTAPQSHEKKICDPADQIHRGIPLFFGRVVIGDPSVVPDGSGGNRWWRGTVGRTVFGPSAGVDEVWMQYALGVDLGTTYSSAAVVRNGRDEIVSLGARGDVLPTVVAVRHDGSVLVGESAERRAYEEPERVAREFKRRIGDDVPVVLDGAQYMPETLLGMVLAHIVETVAIREGGPPHALAVCHPAKWGPLRTERLRSAIRKVHRGPFQLVSEPHAAAVHYASRERVPAGANVAVYDLGGGTFDAAVLQRTTDGFITLGNPRGIDALGGIDFDDAVLGYALDCLGESIDELNIDQPAVAASLLRLRRECTEAKEALSADTDTAIPVMLPNLSTRLRLTRAELEDMIRDRLAETIATTREAIHSAALDVEDIDRVLLVGGSSRIPMAAEMLGRALGRPIALDAHPKEATARGAALLAAVGAGMDLDVELNTEVRVAASHTSASDSWQGTLRSTGRRLDTLEPVGATTNVEIDRSEAEQVEAQPPGGPDIRALQPNGESLPEQQSAGQDTADVAVAALAGTHAMRFAPSPGTPSAAGDQAPTAPLTRNDWDGPTLWRSSPAGPDVGEGAAIDGSTTLETVEFVPDEQGRGPEDHGSPRVDDFAQATGALHTGAAGKTERSVDLRTVEASENEGNPPNRPTVEAHQVTNGAVGANAHSAAAVSARSAETHSSPTGRTLSAQQAASLKGEAAESSLQTSPYLALGLSVVGCSLAGWVFLSQLGY